MLKGLFSNRLFIGALAFFVLCVSGSLLYVQHVEQQTADKMRATEERIKALTEKQNPQPTTEAPVAEAPQGHFHADGTFHAEPHTPEDFSEVTTEVQDARAIAQEATAPIAAPMPDLSKSARDRQAAWKTYDAWYEKRKELVRENLQISRALLDALSIEGLERYNTDENVKREVQRGVRELAPKIADIQKRTAAHRKEEPVLP